MALKSIFIIHFNPVELYPPVQNLINAIAAEPRAHNLYVITTTAGQGNPDHFLSPSKQIKIIRLGKLTNGMPVVKRYLNFLVFYSGCMYYLLVKRPLRVLYYETLSSFPVFLYKKIFNQQAEVMIHYHEYTSKYEKQLQGKLLNYFDHCEKYLYPRATWLSHTNEYRMSAFKEDIHPVKISNKQILPNYPPRSWYIAGARDTIQKPVRIVYVGALSLETMFTEKFAQWVVTQNGNVTWDIYSYNIESEVQTFLKKLNSPFICWKGAVNYEQLPGILREYHIGVVLYNGHIPNYVYNAPNKLFEYLACGLDVWFPSVMKGSERYISNGVYPKVISIDFLKLESFNLNAAIDRRGFSPSQPRYYCEDALAGLINQLFRK